MNRLEKAIELIGTAATMLLFVIMVAQVIMRYIFNFTPVFTEEIGRMLLVWAVLAGSAVSVRHNQHIRVDFLVTLLPQTMQKLWNWILTLLILILFAAVLVYGVESMLFAHSQATSGLQIPLSYPYAGIPIFFGASLLFLIERIVRRER